MTKITTKTALEAKQLRHKRRILAVYFATGMMLPEFTKARLETSSSSITDKTLFVSQQRKTRS